MLVVIGEGLGARFKGPRSLTCGGLGPVVDSVGLRDILERESYRVMGESRGVVIDISKMGKVKKKEMTR
jgi:hypothetical protein